MGLLRRRQRDSLSELLGADARRIGHALDIAADTRDDEDLEPLVDELFRLAPTTDVETLRARGIDAHGFHADELRPNWEGLDRGERAARVAAFMRFANVLGVDDAAGMGPLVRTKVLVLAWAYDRAHGEELLRAIERKPRRFGTLELARAG